MKKHEIAIPVTRHNIEEYVAVLKRHRENIGDVDVTKRYYYLIFTEEWIVYNEAGRKEVNFTPQDLHDFLNNTTSPKKKALITFDTGDKLVEFDGVTVRHTTRHGVKVSCDIPSDRALTRVCQFMESLMKSDLV